MAQIQFKRILNYNGGLQDAIANINSNLNHPLAPGEPLICSYKDNGIDKLILAIGVSENNVRIIPAFNDYEEIINFIKNNNVVINFKDQISEESDFNITESESDGKLIFTLKDDFKNN